MIPLLVTVGYRRSNGQRRQVHVPVPPVLVVLSPLVLLAVLAGLVACRAAGASATRALRDTGRLLWALPGTRFEMEQGRTAVSVSVR
ncbi:hypothetical protein [Streptomyces sp. NPDC058953]|uniref:hypothetical protein n=1 Tax=unclassified Streptomyces TaxID=2593676 RepID=UPI0036947C3A